MIKKIASIILCMILLTCGQLPAFAEDETPSGIALSELENYIDKYMFQYIGETSPGAAVVLIKDGQIIFSKGYGYANLENETSVDPSVTVFEYGSISKVFVYTTIMRLSEEGRIDLNADIREYLPEGFLKKLRYDDPITMMNIMSHTAGFEDYLFDVLLASPDGLPSLEQILQDAQPVQVYKPGTISAYSNYAVSLAAYIAERMIGKDFFEYLMESIFQPLGMEHTSAHPTLSDKPDLFVNKAAGYHSLKNGEFKLGDWSYCPIYPAGSTNGTAEDLARYAIALMPDINEESPLFKNKTTLDEMLSQSHSMGPQMTGFAHGFIEWDGEYRGVGHGGNTIAFSSQFNIVPQERFGVIILTNTSNERDITSGLTEALIGKRGEAEVVVTGTNLPSAKEVEGTYISARRMHYGFLRLYNYLQLRNVKAVDSNTIKFSIAGQTSLLVQTSPYVYQRIEASGSILQHHYGTVYFEVLNGKVLRMSGDSIPISPMDILWLYASLVIVIISVLFFSISLIVFLIRILLRKKVHKHLALLQLCGMATLVNNAVLVMRMLLNNYRSFSELRLHILLNYPLMALGLILILFMFSSWKKSNHTRLQRIYYGTTTGILVAFFSTLAIWQFFHVLG